ncbi:MAG: glycerol-3-phosphate dehydrogenase [Alphaproteobacteria bacterium]|nr:glycerol-3-phosphate dehydrogenase [Alphaproteobacteria bacterium]
MSDERTIDLLVVGGGINGVGIARDAAGRGLDVVLCEQDDLAGHTSSASSKLIHGGLRYLEHYEFRLVREALIEREVLLEAAPHIIRPLRFILPHSPQQRPAWMIRLGLFLYDHLGGRKRLPGSTSVDLTSDPAAKPLKSAVRRAFSYADCWVDDARLVVLNALDAAERGAEILTRTRCTEARRVGDHWKATLASNRGVPIRRIRARALVNAAGPWAASFIKERLQQSSDSDIRLVKGSHVVVQKFFDHDSPYILQNPDGRVVFAIPFEQNFTLVGTTDMEYQGDPADIRIDEGEIDYLLTSVNRYFAEPVSRDRIVWTYAGVRPLFDDAEGNASAVTRDYVFDLASPEGGAPLLSVFGGKLTTYRKLAEHALGKLQPVLGFKEKPWTAGSPLPGGEFDNADFEAFLNNVRKRWNWLPPALARRYARSYGTRIERLLGTADGLMGLGEHFGDDLYEAEVSYLISAEWALTDEDILWRRSKLGLHIGDVTAARLRAWLGRNADIEVPA